MTPQWLMMGMVFIFGLCLGSFLNVCIYRIPISKTIVVDRSACTHCGATIRAYDNIPVLSYLMLLGKCRDCRTPISIRYPLVELLSGGFALAVFLRFGGAPEAAVHYLFICFLLVITFIDIDHRIIPDVISLPGIPIFFAASFLVDTITPLESVFGIVIGGGSLYLVAFLYSLLKKKEGMGGGDIKLLAMIGALLGIKGVLFTIFVSSVLGTVVGGLLMLIKRKDFQFKVPFGPFLAVGAVAYIFFGQQIIYWYLYQLSY